MTQNKDEVVSRLGKSQPISALCILCHDADEALPFYRDILRFDPRRAEESFYFFARRGAATGLCLWEIGHIAKHTAFNAHSRSAIPNKFILSLTLKDQSAVDQLRHKLAKTSAKILPNRPSENANRLTFVDPYGVIWEVNIDNKQNDDSALNRITLICQDLNQTKAFYEEQLGFAPTSHSLGRVFYPEVDNTALSLWDAKSAAAQLNLPQLIEQYSSWAGHTVMLAYGFESMHILQTVYDRLATSGVIFDHAPAYFDWDFNASYFRDPENNIWELFEHPVNIAERMLPNDS